MSARAPRPAPSLWPLQLAAFLATFVFSLGNITSPQIRAALGAGPAQLALIVGAYAAAFAAAIVLCGRIGDRFGRKRLFILGMLGLLVTSLLVAGAANVPMAIAARALQGFAAAVMMPQILSIIQLSAVGQARVRAVSAFGAFSGVGTVGGQVIGGALTSLGGPVWGWRLAFAVFAAACGVCAWAALRLPADAGEPGLRLDFAGAALLALALGGLLTGLAIGPSTGWGAAALIPLSAAVAALVALIVQQRRAEARSAQPLLPPRVLRSPTIAAGMIMAAVFFAGFGAFLYNFALLTQSAHGDPAWLSGLTLAPFATAFVIVSALSHRISARLGGPRALLLGALVQALGLAGVGALSLVAPGHWELWFQLPGVVLGAGQALQFAPLVATVMAEVPGRIAGLTGGLVSTMQQTGIAVGVAVLGSAFQGLSARLGADHAFGVVSLVQLALAAAFGLAALRLRRIAARPAPEVPAGPADPPGTARGA